MIRRTEILFAVVLLIAAPSVSNATLVESWQFNEEAGTQFNGLANDAGSAGFGSGLTHVSTDGVGALAYSQGANVFRNATLTNPDQTTGVFQLEFTFLTATLNGGDASGANVGFGMRDQTTNSDLFLVRLQKQNGELRLQTRIGTTNATLIDFNATTLPDTLKVRAVADLDSDLLNVFTILGSGAEQQVATDVNFSASGLDFDLVRFAANTNSTDWGVSDVVTIDFLTVSAVPEPSAGLFLLLAGIFSGVLQSRKRRL